MKWIPYKTHRISLLALNMTETYYRVVFENFAIQIMSSEVNMRY